MVQVGLCFLPVGTQTPLPQSREFRSARGTVDGSLFSIIREFTMTDLLFICQELASWGKVVCFL